MADTDQRAEDLRLTNAVASALHALNVALDAARHGGLTCDVTPTVRPLVGGPPHVSLNATVTRQKIEFSKRF